MMWQQQMGEALNRSEVNTKRAGCLLAGSFGILRRIRRRGASCFFAIYRTEKT